MIDKILIISCEHQYYRRGVMIGALEVQGYPLENVEIIFGRHANDYTDTQLVEMLSEMGCPNYREGVLDPWTLSLVTSQIRALQYIRSHGVNALLLEDDILPLISHLDLCKKLSKLNAAVEDLGAVQLSYDTPRVERFEGRKHLKILANDWTQGSLSIGSFASFITPYGAERMIDMFSKLETPTNLENLFPKYLYNQPWCFSVLVSNLFRVSRVQGDSMNLYIGNRGDTETNFRFIKKFKLLEG